MAVRVVLWVTLFCGLSVADLTGNVALEAKAVQSSTGDPMGDAQHAVDGDKNSHYQKGSCTLTKTEFNPWWRLDLGKMYRVSRVVITNRGDCCQKRIRGAQIRIGNSLENNGNDNQLAATLLSVPEGTATFDFQPIKGQYVNIFLPGNDEVLSLCEVEVFAERKSSTCSCGQENVALGGEAAQSSTYNHLAAAQNAIDGNTESDYMLGSCTHTGDDDPWWRVDLKDTYRISSIVITNRGDCCEERLDGAQIRIGNSLENNGNDNLLAGTVSHVPLGERAMFVFPQIKGRYVNIFLPGKSKYLTLCEVQVFAEIETPGCTCVPRNLALGGEAAQSSTYNHLAAAQNAIDGNTESDYMRGSCTHTGDDDPWWRVDLKDTHHISSVVITNRGDCCPWRLDGAQIRIGNSLKNNGNDNPLAATIQSIPYGATSTFKFNPINGRYVNVFLPGKNKYLTLCEVQVFAD